MKLRIVIPMLLAALLLCGCANDYKKVSVTSCKLTDNAQFGLKQGKMTATLFFELIVDNPTHSNFEIVDASAWIYDKNGTEFGGVNLLKSFRIKPGYEQTLTVGADFYVNNPLSMLFRGGIDPDNKEIDIVITAKQNGFGPIKKEYSKIPLSLLFNKFNLKI